MNLAYGILLLGGTLGLKYFITETVPLAVRYGSGPMEGVASVTNAALKGDPVALRLVKENPVLREAMPTDAQSSQLMVVQAANNKALPMRKKYNFGKNS